MSPKSKLGPHIQVFSDPSLRAIRELQPTTVKVMDPKREELQKIRAAAPDTIIVVRCFVENQDYNTNPVLAGREHAERFRAIADLIDVAEVYNEPINNGTTGPELHHFDAFQDAFTRTLMGMNDHVQAGLFCLPTGNLGWDGEVQLTPEFFPLTFTLPKSRVIICLHEYTWGRWDFELGARLLRFVRQMAWAATHGFQCIITEWSFTQFILGRPHPDEGWRTNSEPKMVRADVITGAHLYDMECQKYPWLLGVDWFTIDLSNGWGTFESLNEWAEAVKLMEGATK
jgi:hypothetical protein